MNETPFFFERDGIRLFGILHAPSSSASGLGLVLSHALAEEKLWSHRVFVSFARALAARGTAVLRFDYMGAGDSDGRTEDSSLASHLDDLAAATRTLDARIPNLDRIGVAGLRLGATLAALLVESGRGDLPGSLRRGPLILWEPVLDGTAYLQDVLRGNLSMQMASFGKVVETREAMVQRIREGGSANVDGYEIGRGLLESVGVPDLLPTGPKRHAGPVLITPVLPAAKRKPRPDLEALAAGYPRAEIVPADEEPFWREIKRFYGSAPNLQALTLDWLGRADD